MTNNAENDARVRVETQTQFLRDGEWLPHVLIRRSEVGRVRFRHRVITITTHEGEWQQGRASGSGCTCGRLPHAPGCLRERRARVIPPEQTQPPPGHEEPWEWHPDGPEAHAMLEKIQDEETP